MSEDVNFCPRCGKPFPARGSFCPFCGLDVRYLRDIDSDDGAPESPDDLSRYLQILGAWTSLILLAVLFLNVVLAIWGAQEVLPEIGAYGVDIFIIVPEIIDLFLLMDWAAVLMYLLFLVAVVVSFIYLVYQSKDRILPELRGQASDEKSPLYALTTMFVALICFQIIYYLILLDNVEINVPDISAYPLWYQLYALLRASVWEEVITRILYIGVPVLIILYASHRMQGKWYRYLLGGFELNGLSMAFVVLSSFMFGLGHLSGWDYYKILPSMLAGLGMGYLFVKYGVHASIMLHFAFDYLSVPSLLFDSVMVTALSGMLLLFFMAMGFPFMFHYARVATEALIGRKISFGTGKRTEAWEDEGYMHIPRPVCPSCGNDRVRVLDDGFECLSCGKRF